MLNIPYVKDNLADFIKEKENMLSLKALRESTPGTPAVTVKNKVKRYGKYH